MPFNGAGIFNRLYSWVADAAAGIDISSSRMDTDTNDIATGLTDCLTRDGQSLPTSNLSMGNFRHTGASNGVALTDYATVAQLQNSAAVSWAVAGGTGDALTATFAPALTTLVDGQLCFARAPGANTVTAPTFTPNGLPLHPITTFGGQSLLAGDIFGPLHELILRYNLAGARWELLNPSISVIAPLSVITASIANAAVTYAKIQNVTAARLLGNSTGGAASPLEISLGAGLGFSGSTILIPDAGIAYAKIQAVTAARLLGNSTGAPAAPSEISLGAEFSFSGASIVIATSSIGYAKLQNVTAARLLGNPTGGATAPSEITLGTGLSFSGSTLNSAAIPPTTQALTAGTGATYTTPAGVKWLEILVVGGGSGGGGANSAVLSTAGSSSAFGALTAGGGAGSSFNAAGAGGTATGGNVSNMVGAPGGAGNVPALNHNSTGGAGGCSSQGGAGAGSNSNTTGTAATTNSGSGGGGGGSSNGSLDGSAGCGGASGGTVRHIYTAPAASYTYTVGPGGAGAAGTSINSSAGGNGGAGAAGIIIVIEHY